MSKNVNRSKLKNVLTRKEYKINNWNLDPYYDECWGTHRTTYFGWAKWSNKQLYRYQVRLYRTWKHNRKTQYKI